MNLEQSTDQDFSNIDPLDLEFKNILCVIREHIPYINNNQYLNQCRIWLEKLSNCSDDKGQRNLYLAELARQVKKNKLTAPFHQLPPVGCLKNFHGNFKIPKLNKIKEEIENKSLTSISETTLNFEEFEGLVEPLNSEDDKFSIDCLKPLDEPIKLINSVTNFKENINKNDPGQEDTKLNNTNLTIESNLNVKNEQKASQANLYQETHKDHNIDFKNSLETNDSWVDISETSSSEFMFLGESNTPEKTLQRSNVRNLKRTQDTLKKRLDLVEKRFLSHPKILEMIYPKTKILKDTNYLSEDWKNTIAALQLRLSEMMHQNKELKSTIKRLELQIQDDAKQYEADLSKQLKITDDHWIKEINKIKELHADNIFDLENALRNKLQDNNLEHEHRYDKLLDDCEKRINEVKCDKEGIIEQKDEEIQRLTGIIQERCVSITEEITNLQSQISSCSCDEKMKLLRKCIGKMEKLFHRSEKDHLKKIEKLRQELEIKESSLQIQLKTQKAELLTKTSSERQEEFEHIVNTLEVKYIEMLEMHEVQVMAVKKKSDKKIERLIELLMKNGVAMDQIEI